MARNTERSNSYFNTATNLFPGGVNSPVRAFRSVGGTPFIVERGEGPYLYDVDGNRYVDFINSWGPLVLGHAHPAVCEAIAQQAQRGTSYGACALPEIELAQYIMKYVPSIEMIRFVSSGTEAGMAVARLCRGFTGRQKLLKFSGCYHGHADSFLVQAGSGVATLGLPDSPGVSQHIAQDTITARFNDLDQVRDLMREHGNQCAAIVLEPIVGNAGFIKPLPGFLSGLRDLCDQYGTLLVFDEVMTGFRVDRRGAQHVYQVKPDLTMLGKVIGGGLPVGAFGGRRDIMEKIAPTGPVYQAGTLSGNPLAMVAGLTTLKLWLEGDVFDQTSAITRVVVESLQKEAQNSGTPLVADCQGTMFGFFFSETPVRSYEDAKCSDTERFKRFFHTMLDRGVYFAPSAYEAGFVSYAHGGEALRHVIDNLEGAMSQIIVGQ